MKKTCGCCDGARPATPATTANLPGRSALSRRVGRYGTFLESMRAELSSRERPGLAALRTRAPSDPAMAFADAWAVACDVLTFYHERLANEGYLRTATERLSVVELASLIGYAPRPGVSATVFLAYAIDQKAAPVVIPAGSKAQSVPDPGEDMQTFETAEALEARVEWNALAPRLTLPTIIRVLDALTMRRLRLTGTALNLRAGDRLLFAFVGPSRPEHVAHVVRRVARARPLFESNVTEVELQPKPRLTSDGAQAFIKLHDRLIDRMAADAAVAAEAKDLLSVFDQYALGEDVVNTFVRANRAAGNSNADVRTMAAALADLAKSLLQPVKRPPANPMTAVDPLALISLLDRPPVRVAADATALARTIAGTFTATADIAPQLLTRLRPRVGEAYYQAWRNLPALGGPPPAKAPDLDRSPYGGLVLDGIHAFRNTTVLFGQSAPHKLVLADGHVVENGSKMDDFDTPGVIWLEQVDEEVTTESVVFIEAPFRERVVALAGEVSTLSRDSYGVVGKATHVELLHPGTRQPLAWRDITDTQFSLIRTTVVHVRSERLELAGDPDPSDVGRENTIELGALLEGLQSGRRLIVAGERTDVVTADGSVVRGIHGQELMMLAGLVQGAREPGDLQHTMLKLADPLANTYRRDSVRIYANVVKATHGETHDETLGSGNAAQPFQRFTLQRDPLTYVSAPTPSGVETTLVTRVNDVRWREVDTLAPAAPSERVYVVRIGEESATTVTFGSGEHGSRLPTGTVNVRAIYRSGMGRGGNVKPERITLLASRPLGVRDVTNPMRASGGADAEDRDHVRANAPLAVAALDRLVGIRDYADFARTFGGVGHAAAASLTDGAQQVVHVTVAGIDDIPIDADSDLLHNLARALRRFGDPRLPVVVAPRELMALVLSASISFDPDYLWLDVSGRVRAALLDAFSFARRGLGRSAYLSEALAAIQAVRGVTAVDVDVFDAISERDLTSAEALRKKIGQLASTGESTLDQPRAVVAVAAAQTARHAPDRASTFPPGTRLLPAQLAFFVPEVADTLILNRR